MNQQERIDILIEKAGSGSKLAEMISTTSASLSKLRTGKFHIEAFAPRIAQAFPDVNCRWLLTGEGEPFSKEADEGEIRAELRALSEKMDKVLSKQK